MGQKEAIIGTAEGEICGVDGCKGVLEFYQETCICHINPPCHYCTSAILVCTKCGREVE